MVCDDFKNILRRTASDKILADKAFNIAWNLKYNGYQRGLFSMLYKFLIKNLLLLLLLGLLKINLCQTNN